MITKEQVETVRNLAQKHLGHCQYTSGVYPSDEVYNETLIDNQTPVPMDDLSLRSVEKFWKENNLQGSDAYMKKFRGECIFAGMASEARKEKAAATIGFIAGRLKRKFNGAW